MYTYILKPIEIIELIIILSHHLMCLPIGCLKCIIGFQAWVTFLVGIGTMIIAIIFTVNEGDNI